MFLRTIILMGCIAFVACSTSQAEIKKTELQTIETKIVETKAIPDLSLGRGSGSRKNVIIKDQVAWSELWREHTKNSQPIPPIPLIDFEKNMVIGIFLGAYPNSCYSMTVTSVMQDAERTLVKYKVNSPAPDMMCPQVMVNLYKLITVPKLSGEVTFVDENKK